eukprot:UN02585
MSIKVQQYRYKKTKRHIFTSICITSNKRFVIKMCTTSRNCITNNCRKGI